MNKMKRIFSLVLALVMVLGAFGNVVPAFAETVDAEVTTEELTKVPADVIGTDYEAAVRRLVAFGLIEGYPDGTYQPEKEINRAQFAKLLVVALGLDDAVRAAEGQSTGFSDVKGDYWAAGYINVASGQGLLKGYPDGTFRPAAKVTYAHALTMLVRALGYQDEFLPGNWPGNYVAKAADVGITRGLRLPAASTEGSKRGIVAQLINNTLNSKIVEVSKYVGISGIEYEEKNETLLKNRLDISKHEDTRIYADKLVDDGLEKDEVRIKFLEKTREDDEVRNPKRKGDVEVFDTKVSVRPFIGEEVTTYLTDRDEIIYVERENNDKAYFDYVDKVKDEKVNLVRFDKNYDFDVNKDVSELDADIYIFNSSDNEYKRYTGEELNKSETLKQDIVGRNGKFVVRNNKIVYAEVQDSAEVSPWLVVMKNDDNVLEGINKETEDYKIDLTKGKNYDDVLVFDTEGHEMSVKDIKRGNLVYVQEQDYDGDDVAVVTVVQDNVVTGEAGKFRLDRVEIGGKTYKAIKHDKTYDAYYTVDGLERIERWNEAQIEDDLEDAYGEEVTAYLDATGKIAFLTTDVDAVSGYKFGVVTRTYADGDRVRIYTTIDGKEGKDTIFKADKEANLKEARVINWDNTDKKFTEEGKGKGTGKVILGQPVKFKLNNDGEISKDEFFVMNSEALLRTNGDFGVDTIKTTHHGSFSVRDSVQIIDAKGLDAKKVKTELNKPGNDMKYGDIESFKAAGEDPITGKNVDVDDFDIAKWEDVKDKSANGLEYYIFPKTNRAKEVDGLVFVGKHGANTGSDEVAVYVTKVERRGGDEVQIEYYEYGSGKGKETILVDNADRISEVAKEKAYVAKHKSNGKIELLNLSNVVDLKGTSYKEENKSNAGYEDFVIHRNVVVVDTGANFKVRLGSDDNATLRTFVDRGAQSYFEDKSKDVKAGDLVDIVVAEDVTVRIVGINKEGFRKITEDDKLATPSDPELGGNKVTYINSDASMVDINGTPVKVVGDAQILLNNYRTQLNNAKIAFSKNGSGEIYKLTAIEKADFEIKQVNANTPITGITFSGNLTLDTGATNIVASNVTVNGKLEVKGNAALAATKWNVKGTTTLNTSGVVTFNSKLDGDVLVTQVGTASGFTNVTFGGNLVVDDADVTIKDSTIAKDFDAKGKAVKLAGKVTVTGDILGAANIDVTGVTDQGTKDDVADAKALATAQGKADAVVFTTGAAEGKVKLDSLEDGELEYSLNGAAYVAFADGTTAEIEANIGDKIVVRVKATPAAKKELTVAASNIGQAAAPNASLDTNDITGLTEDVVYEVRITKSTETAGEWNTFTANADGKILGTDMSFTAANGDAVEVRVKATTKQPASAVKILQVS